MRNLITVTLALVMLIEGAGVARAASTATPLDLDAALAIALRQNTDYRTAHVSVAAAEAVLHQARVPLGPSVTLQDNYQYATPSAVLSTPIGPLPFQPNSTNVPLLGIDYMLSDGGVTAARVGSAAATLASMEAGERESRAAVVQQVSIAYYDLVTALRGVVVAQGAIALAQGHLTLAQQLYAAGQVPRAEVLQAQTDLAQRRFDAIEARARITHANVALDVAMNVPLSTLYEPTDRLDGPAPDFDLDKLIASSNASRAEIAAARFAVDAARRALDAARAGRAPRIALSASEGNVQPVVTTAFKAQFTVGLSAVWKLFDNGANSSRVAEAEAGLQRAQLAVERLRVSVEAEIRDAYAQFASAQERDAAARELVTLADENQRLAEVQYRGGVGTSLEVRDAELRAVTARQGLLDAQRALRESVVALQFSAGLL